MRYIFLHQGSSMIENENYCFVNIPFTNKTCKNFELLYKVQPRTGHEGPDGE
jgi:hypothetical protein